MDSPGAQTPASDAPPEARPTLPAAVRLPEREAGTVLLVRAVEEDEVEAKLLDAERRAHATERARATALEGRAGSAESFGPFLADRARDLAEHLTERYPALGRLRRAARLAPAAAWVLVPMLGLGLATNLLGPDKRINVVANPLAALLLWNFGVYALLCLRNLGRGRTGAEASVEERGQPSLAVRLATHWLARPARHAGPGTHFLAGWTRTAAPLLGARLARHFHLGAFTLVLGALLGMYARGLLFEYRATWESTFLEASAVEGWLGALFLPATLLTGLAPPEVAAIRSPEHGPAAAWIHLYAITTGLAVLLPRLLLAWRAGSEARRVALGLELPTRAPYFRRLWGELHGRTGLASVLPVSYTLAPARADRLRALLHDVLGPRARLRVESPLTYGAGLVEDEPWPGETQDPDAPHVLLFNLAQTPESEVHGRLARRLAGSPGGGVVLVDGAAFRERTDPATLERRLTERRRTWDRVLREEGLEPVHVNLDAEPAAGLAEAVERAWRAPRQSD